MQLGIEGVLGDLLILWIFTDNGARNNLGNEVNFGKIGSGLRLIIYFYLKVGFMHAFVCEID